MTIYGRSHWWLCERIHLIYKTMPHNKSNGHTQTQAHTRLCVRLFGSLVHRENDRFHRHDCFSLVFVVEFSHCFNGSDKRRFAIVQMDLECFVCASARLVLLSIHIDFGWSLFHCVICRYQFCITLTNTNTHTHNLSLILSLSRPYAQLHWQNRRKGRCSTNSIDHFYTLQDFWCDCQFSVGNLEMDIDRNVCRYLCFFVLFCGCCSSSWWCWFPVWSCVCACTTWQKQCLMLLFTQ